MRLVKKILPLVLGCAILLGISGASASCSYIGVAAGDSYDFKLTIKETTSSRSETRSGIYRLIVANVTPSGCCCSVGIVLNITSGNIDQSDVRPVDSSNYGPGYNLIVPDATSFMNVTMVYMYIISTNVVDKSYDYNAFGETHTASWDSNGMLTSRAMSGTYGGLERTYNIERYVPSPVSGYESWALLIAGAIGIAGVIGIVVKKFHVIYS